MIGVRTTMVPIEINFNSIVNFKSSSLSYISEWSFWCTDEPHANMDEQDSPWPELGGSTTFPLLIFSMLGHEACTQMSFCLGTPKLGSQNSLNWDLCDFGGP